MKEAGGEAPTVWSRLEVKKIQYGGGVWFWIGLILGKGGVLGWRYIVGRAQVTQSALYY
jgi:predicted negative regulator of RcsB-dependent stress response